MPKAELRDIRGGVVSYIFQDPSASLNPVFRVGSQIKESLKLHRPAKATDEEVIRLLKLVAGDDNFSLDDARVAIQGFGKMGGKTAVRDRR